MLLNAAKRRHVVTLYASVSNLLRQMEDAATEGRSPTGVGAALTPLEQHEAEPVLAPVRELKAKLRQAAETYAAEELGAFERPKGARNTLVWLSNLLDRVRASVDDLQPTRVGKYGAVDDAERAMFASLHEELFGKLSVARDALQGRVD